MTFFLFGFYSLLSQALLLREVAQIFGAHELSLAGALAAWVLWTAAGVFLAGSFRGPQCTGASQHPTAAGRYFAAACVSITVIVPANILAARFAPALLTPALQPGLLLMLAGPALLTLPAGLTGGLAAGFGLRRLPARFYGAEAAGAAAAGLLTVAYYRFFPQLSVLLLLTPAALALAAVCIFRKPFSKIRLVVFALTAAALAALNSAESYAWRLKPPAAKPGLIRQTQGARFALTGPPGKRTFYEDGSLLAAPEDTAWEELAHIPLLTLNKPDRVLLSGSGALFLLPEILKHRPKTVEIAEPDFFKSAFLAQETGVDVKKIKIITADLRALPPETLPYDAVFQTLAAADNAAMNRYFTSEFFASAAALLKPDGLLVFQLPFAANYLPPGKAFAIASILASAEKTFPSITLIPGGRLTVLAGAKAPNLDPQSLAAVYVKRGLNTATIVPSAFPFILNPYRKAWVAHELGKIKDPPLNSDLVPLAYFHFWRVWLSMVVSPGALLGLAALALCALCAALALAGRLKFTARERTGEAFFIGFWTMAFETALLLAFQAKTGRLNPELGGLFAVFMAAAGTGAVLPLKTSRVKLITTETAAAVLALTCALGANFIFAHDGGTAVWGLMAAGGLCTGIFFTQAAGIDGGAIYAWDLLGGAAGGFVTAAFSAPILGIKGAFFCAGLAALCALAGGAWAWLKTDG